MFVCIVGTSRCGTTLLRHMMHDHPDLVVFRETHWLPKLIECFGTQKVPPEALLAVVEKTTRVGGEDLLSVNLAYSPFETKQDLLAALRSALGRSGYLTIQAFSALLVRTLFDWAGLWGDKTPDYGFYMGSIQSLWPRCRFIHLIRDGLATAHSMARHPGCQLMLSAGVDNWCSLSYDRLFEKYQVAPLPLQDYVASWRRRLNRIRDEANRLREGTYREVRYEDLIREPQTTLAGICSFLGLSSPGAWLASCAGLVRSSPQGPAMDRELFHRLGAEDLVALNQHRSETPPTVFRFLADTPPDDLAAVADTAERTLRAGLGQRALDLAIQLMTTQACHQNQSLLAAAHDVAIRASHQCGAFTLKQHWLQSARQYGFVFPAIPESHS